jgi:HK97 family phage major capsid protein
MLSGHGSLEVEESFALQRDETAWRDNLGLGDGLRTPDSVSLRVPWARLMTRDLNTLTGGGGAFTVGLDVPEIQQSLRPTSLFMKLPIQVLQGCSGNIVLPRIGTGMVPSPETEISSVSSSDVVFNMTNGGPHRIAVQCTFSRQLLAQAGGNVAFDVFMATELKRAISFQLDTYLLQGTGINAQPIGILNQPGLTSNTYGATTTWPMVVAIIKSLEAAYIDNDNAVWVLGPSTAAKWRTAIRQASNAFYIMEDHGPRRGAD